MESDGIGEEFPPSETTLNEEIDHQMLNDMEFECVSTQTVNQFGFAQIFMPAIILFIIHYIHLCFKGGI